MRSFAAPVFQPFLRYTLLCLPTGSRIPFDPHAPSFSFRCPVTRFTIVYGPTTGNRQVPQAGFRQIHPGPRSPLMLAGGKLGCSLPRLGGTCCRTRFSCPNFDLTARPVRNSIILAELGMAKGRSLHASESLQDIGPPQRAKIKKYFKAGWTSSSLARPVAGAVLDSKDPEFSAERMLKCSRARALGSRRLAQGSSTCGVECLPDVVWLCKSCLITRRARGERYRILCKCMLYVCIHACTYGWTDG